MPPHVDIISDVICPWCYIGKRRLERAIATLGRLVQVRWLPFQMNPAMPKDGIPRREYRTRKFGTWERSLELDAQVEAAGKGEGIDFAFQRMERTPNTLDAHRLIWLADQQGIQDAVVEGLFRAYFEEARDISNRQTLLDVIVEAGLERQRAIAALENEEGIEALQEGQDQTRRFRVESVPFFIIHGEVGLMGAQSPEVFLEVLRQKS